MENLQDERLRITESLTPLKTNFNGLRLASPAYKQLLNTTSLRFAPASATRLLSFMYGERFRWKSWRFGRNAEGSQVRAPPIASTEIGARVRSDFDGNLERTHSGIDSGTKKATHIAHTPETCPFILLDRLSSGTKYLDGPSFCLLP